MDPQEVSALDMAFSTDVSHLMPEEIPNKFRSRNNQFVRIVSTWFYKGLDSKLLEPKPGINKSIALSHLSAIMRSFEPAHENKIAAVAYLMSLWFDLK